MFPTSNVMILPPTRGAKSYLLAEMAEERETAMSPADAPPAEKHAEKPAGLPALEVSGVTVPQPVIDVIERAHTEIGDSANWANLKFPATESGEKDADTFEADARDYCKTRPAGVLTFRRQAVDTDGRNVAQDDETAIPSHVRFRVTVPKEAKSRGRR